MNTICHPNRRRPPAPQPPPTPCGQLVRAPLLTVPALTVQHPPFPCMFRCILQPPPFNCVSLCVYVFLFLFLFVYVGIYVCMCVCVFVCVCVAPPFVHSWRHVPFGRHARPPRQILVPVQSTATGGGGAGEAGVGGVSSQYRGSHSPLRKLPPPRAIRPARGGRLTFA